jgi:hypothetical protein
MLTTLNDEPDVSGHADKRGFPPPARFRCRIYRGNRRKSVYWDVDELGTEAFWEEEDGEVKSYPFKPSPAERRALQNLADKIRNQGFSRAYIDLDVEPECLLMAEQISLESFRTFAYEYYGEEFAVALDRKIAAFLTYRLTSEANQHE